MNGLRALACPFGVALLAVLAAPALVAASTDPVVTDGAPGSVAGQPTVGALAPLGEAEVVARRHLRAGNLHGAVGLLGADGASRALFGAGPVEPDGEALDGSVRFRLASLSKVLTRVAILRLVDAGRLGLDDSLARHRPGLDAEWAETVSLRQLLGFRSGLPRERPGATDPVDAGVRFDADGRALAFLDGLDDVGPEVEPGTQVLYSNLGYFHLGGVLEAVTELPVEAALGELVFEPAGMTGTTLGDAQLADDVRRARGHARDGDGVVSPVPPFPVAPRYTAGGFVSTLDDLLALSRALLHGGLLTPRSTALLLDDFGDGDEGTFRVAGMVPGFANVWSLAAEPPTAVVVLNHVLGPSPQVVVDAHDEIAEALRGAEPEPAAARPDRASDGWKPLTEASHWPQHELMAAARRYLERSRDDVEALYAEELAVRGHADERRVDEESREVYRWLAAYQVALHEHHGPFELAWWRPAAGGAFEFLCEGPDGRALRYRLKPDEGDPRVASTLAVATMGFDADSSLYEGLDLGR